MSSNNPSVVFVHGAWAEGSSWGKVIDALTADGTRAVAAPQPLTSLADDTAALERTLERIEGPVLLVGHAYAGAVIASVRAQKVAALVYIAALAPDEGEKVADVFYRAAPRAPAPKSAPDAHGFIWLPEDAFASAFAQNATAAELTRLAAVQRPIAVASITVPVGRPLWKDRPSFFLVAEDDRMIAPETQRFMAQRMKAIVRAWPVDHTPSVTAPEAVVAIMRWQRAALARRQLTRRVTVVRQFKRLRHEDANNAHPHRVSHRERRRHRHLLSRG
jgi:pimeloyl-ACP methyl ester carboxylesterase